MHVARNWPSGDQATLEVCGRDPRLPSGAAPCSPSASFTDSARCDAEFRNCRTRTTGPHVASAVASAVAAAAACGAPPAALVVLASFLLAATSSARFTSARPSRSTCFLKISATGGKPEGTRLKRRNIRARSSVLSSRNNAAHPECSFSSKRVSYVANASRSTSFSSFASDDACR